MIYYVISGLQRFFFKQKSAYEMRISDCSSDVCSSDLYSDAAVMHRTAEPQHLVIQRLPAAVHTDIAGFGKFQCVADEIDQNLPNPRGEIGRASCRERVCQYV